MSALLALAAALFVLVRYRSALPPDGLAAVTFATLVGVWLVLRSTMTPR